MILKKDNLYFGILVGLIFPVIAFTLVKFGMGNLINNKPFALYGFVALLNLLIMRYFYHFRLSKSGQGVILVTFFILMFLLFSTGYKIGASQ
jgi:hypothetical protein